MDEQMRDVKLSLDEIKDLMDWLEPEHDGRDFESECPSCTSYRKLSAALSQPAAQGDSSHPAGGEFGRVQVPAVADEGWIDWMGGRCPVPDKEVVDVKLREGAFLFHEPAFSLSWAHFHEGSDILAYRIAKAAP